MRQSNYLRIGFIGQERCVGPYIIIITVITNARAIAGETSSKFPSRDSSLARIIRFKSHYQAVTKLFGFRM